MASSAHGIVRSTLAVDLVVQMDAAHCEPLSADLGKDWYADSDFMRASPAHSRAFNLIHLPTGQKFDLFPATGDFQRSQLARGQPRPVPQADPLACNIATAEDILLAKLRWYRDGNEVSERQWSDILGILAVNPSLDITYLDRWAAALGVADLLERARGE